MSILTDLQEAREVILKEENWTQAVFARDKDGWRVDPTDEEACQWCALGALSRVTFWDASRADFSYEVYQQGGHRYDTALQPLRDATHYLYGDNTSVPDANDTLTHAEVLKMYDKAIELVKGQA